MNSMKKLMQFFLSLGVLVLLSQVDVKAQSEEITDEELIRYAVVMDSVETMREAAKLAIEEMVKSNENMTGTRYNELSKIMSDANKLAAANATEEEVAFINEVKEKSDAIKAEINAAFQSMAKDYIGEGGRTYNKISKALRTDADLKARYAAILEKVQSDELARVE
jgi:RecA/RadA recombinase